MKNLLFNLKAVQTGSYITEVAAGPGNFLKAGAGAGAETNSFGSATQRMETPNNFFSKAACCYSLPALLKPYQNLNNCTPSRRL
jgi:hypothetical protein